MYASQLDVWQEKFADQPAPATNRTHCIVWSDYDTQPQVELAHGIRLDTNYYYWPGPWVLDRPGLFTGTGFPQRFATAGGDLVDVYQATTQMTDESQQSYPATINTLLDNATGPLGYYGVFTANIHTDTPTPGQWSAIVDVGAGSWRADRVGPPDARLARRPELVVVRRDVVRGNVARLHGRAATRGHTGCRAWSPRRRPKARSSRPITRNGSPVTFTVETRKGVDYAVFDAPSGAYAVTYTLDTTAPSISSVVATVGATRHGHDHVDDRTRRRPVVSTTARPPARSRAARRRPRS